MFSGIVQEKGRITSFTGGDSMRLGLSIKQIGQCRIGDSVAVNGVCLTITHINCTDHILYFDVTPETLIKTNLSLAKLGNLVNIELSLKISDRIGGHFVQGHVEDTGEIYSIEKEDTSLLVQIKAKSSLLRYLVDKGYIAIDGMSITVIHVTKHSFSVLFIPHTVKNTIVQTYKRGQKVNLEVDPLSKHIYKYMENSNAL